ncbi:MAG: hypothetical protein ACT4QF_25050 [Sporichthyaceae bacterium]
MLTPGTVCAGVRGLVVVPLCAGAASIEQFLDDLCDHLVRGPPSNEDVALLAVRIGE